MKIHLKVNFAPDVSEVDTESVTLGELLLELSRKYPDSKFYNKERDEVIFDQFVELNGEMHENLPRELDTKLKDGDKLEIYSGIDYPDD